MIESAKDKSSGPTTAEAALRDHFLGWQCRIRQYAVRHGGGRPSSGMRPSVSLWGAGAALGPITVLIVKREPEVTTAQFRHLARKTHDPAERRDGALKFLAAAYHQRPQDFSDEPAALFGPESEIADGLLGAGRCRLRFEQYRQTYDLPCQVRQLADDDPAFQATYWHNALFNAALPAGVRVLAFRPDWSAASADPPVS
jgi:hypothetical protein